MGNSIAGDDRKKLADIYDNLYRIDALKALLCVNHPHHLKESLSKGDIIQGIIDAVLGIPTVQEWNNIMQKYDELRDQANKAAEDSEDDKDPSKASRHSTPPIPKEDGCCGQEVEGGQWQHGTARQRS